MRLRVRIESADIVGIAWDAMYMWIPSWGVYRSDKTQSFRIKSL